MGAGDGHSAGCGGSGLEGDAPRPSLRPIHGACKQFATDLLERKEDVIAGKIPVGPLLGFEGRMGPHLHVGNSVSFKRKSRLHAVIRAPKIPRFQDLGRSAHLFRHVPFLGPSSPIQIGRNDVGGLNPQSSARGEASNLPHLSHNVRTASTRIAPTVTRDA